MSRKSSDREKIAFAQAERTFWEDEYSYSSSIAVPIHWRARRALGIHWGTFEISHEPLDQPPRDVAAALKAQALPPDHVWLMKQGEVRALPVEEAR